MYMEINTSDLMFLLVEIVGLCRIQFFFAHVNRGKKIQNFQHTTLKRKVEQTEFSFKLYLLSIQFNDYRDIPKYRTNTKNTLKCVLFFRSKQREQLSLLALLSLHALTRINWTSLKVLKLRSSYLS